jgi:hypothetical protein
MKSTTIETLEMLGREAPLILLIGCLFFILAGGGGGLGLPDLFWNGTLEEPGHSPRAGRFVTGLAVGVFLSAAVFVWLLVESGLSPWTLAAFREHDAFLRWLRWLSMLLGVPFLACWVLGAFVRTRMTAGESFEIRWGGLLPLAVGISLVAFPWLVEWFTAHTPTWLREKLANIIPGLHPPPPLVEFHVTAAILVLLAVLAYLVLVFLFARSVYPGFAICVLMIFIAGTHGFVAFRFGAGQIIVYLLCGLAYSILNAGWQRARVPELEAAVRGQSAVTPLLADHDVLNAWKRHQAGERPPGLVVLAASGGGIRAALWTGVVLTALEDTWSEFPGRLRLITGASGGMLGAAEWTATLPGPPEARIHSPGLRHQVLDALERGGLKAVSSGLILRDLLPPPLRYGEDRGRLLEGQWESYCPVLANPLSRLAAGEEAGWRPTLVLSPTVVEDGRFLVISNLDLAPLLRSEGPRLPFSANTLYAIQGFQLFDYLPDARTTLRLSTAVRLQANFPYVLPSTEVPGVESGHVRAVDAGYRDDWGIELASSWIARNRDWLAGNTSGVVLIQVRDTLSQRTAPPSGERRFLARGIDGLATPLEGLVSTWKYTAASRNDEMVDELARTINKNPSNPFFTTVVFELEHPVAPLTWSLTTAEAKNIRAGLSSANNLSALEGFVAWAATH